MATDQPPAVGINTYAKAANVAHTLSVDQQQNNVGTSQSSWENNSSYTNTFNNCYFTPSWPEDQAVRYGFNQIPPSNTPNWSFGQRKFISPDENALQQSRIAQRWKETIPIAVTLRKAINFFKSQCDLESEYTEMALKDIEKSTRTALKVTMDAYPGSRRILRHLDKYMTAFFSWLSVLDHDQHGCLLCIAINVVLDCLAGEDGFLSPVVKLMVEMLSKFSTLTVYLKTNKNVCSKMHETIDAFELVARFFIDLLYNGQIHMKDRKVEEMDLQIRNIAAVLNSADAKAKNIGKVDPDNTSILHALPRSEHMQPFHIENLFLCVHAASGLYAAITLMPPHSIGNPTGPNHSGGIPLQDLDEETKRRVSGSISAVTTEEGLSISDLSKYLKFDKAALATDVERCASISVVKPANMMQRLSKLTRRAEFQSWLSETSQASAILIHGNLQTRTSMTPLSYLCAKISKEYAGKPGFIILAHFCGLHARVRDKEDDAKAMLTSFIRQLLLQPTIVGTYDPDNFNKHLVKNLKKKDIDTLGRVFRALINQLRSTSMVVFCLIDSISYYEDPSRRHDTGKVLSRLNEIVGSKRGRRRKERDRIMFKLMVTAGGKSVEAHKYFKCGRVLEMNETVDGNTSLKLA